MVDDTDQSTTQKKPKPKRTNDGVGLVRATCDAICKINNFAVDPGGKLHHWQDGAYHPNGDAVVKKLAKRFVIATNQDKTWHRSFSSDCIEFIAIDAPRLWDRPPVEVLNVKNGLLRIRDRTLQPHSPRHLSVCQLPITYDPAATCPAINRFISQVFPEDSAQLAYEIPGWLMLPITSIQKAILLNGPGGNGKSTYLNMICSFLGKSNYSSLALHKLESDRFAASRLVGKLANICPDLPTVHLEGTSVFKATTGGDFLTAEYKFCDSFDFEPFARLVFSSNALPQSNDNSQGFFDRWIVVPFDRSFRGTSEEIPSAELGASLASDSELSGLLNKALDAIDSVKARKWRLHTSPTLQAAHQEFHSITDPLGVWLDQFTVDDPGAVVPRATLRAAYGAECERKGRPLLSEKSLGIAIKKHRPKLPDDKQRLINGRVQWCYIGLGLRSNESPTSQQAMAFDSKSGSRDSLDSLDIPNLFSPTNHMPSEAHEDVEISRDNPVNPVNPVNGECIITRENDTSANLDDINNLFHNCNSDDPGVML